LKELPRADGAGSVIKVMAGRYGPYVTDGKTNATLPKDADPASVTLDEALALIAAREAKRPPKGKSKRAAKTPIAKTKAELSSSSKPKPKPRTKKAPAKKTTDKPAQAKRKT
jgi:DNA topoisomerase-1